MDDTKEFRDVMNKRHQGAITTNQKDMLKYIEELKYFVNDFNPIKGSGINKEVKILNIQQMFSRLPILFAQIQAGNN